MHNIDRYEETTKQLALDGLAEEHYSLVKKIALYVKKKLPSHIEMNDLLQSGMIGLLEARQKYRHDMNASFETYASIRIRGAIIDYLRKNSWCSRDTIKNMRRVSDAITAIEQRNQKHATTEEIAAELGMSLEEHFKMSQEISISHVMSLDDMPDNHAVFNDDDANPQMIIQEQSLKNQLEMVLQELPEREQQVLSLYYVDEFTFKQIGEILSLTEARICQLHSQALVRVRAKIKKNSRELIG